MYLEVLTARGTKEQSTDVGTETTSAALQNAAEAENLAVEDDEPMTELSLSKRYKNTIAKAMKGVGVES